MAQRLVLPHSSLLSHRMFLSYRRLVDLVPPVAPLAPRHRHAPTLKEG
jgi:hypothetical protein